MPPKGKMSTRKAKGKSPYVPSSSRNPESDDEGNEPPVEEEGEELVEPPPSRRRKRTAGGAVSARQKKWEEGMAGRNVKNERHVDAGSFGASHRAIRRITEQGLSYFFGKCEGFNKSLVVAFYKKMVVPDAETFDLDNAQITSKIGRLDIVITRDTIAAALDYIRPAANETNYPRDDFATFEEICQAFYEGNVDNLGDTHVPGRFREGYKLINQFVHHNLNPRGAENKPSFEDGVLLYAFMQPGVKADWASYIFLEIDEFKTNAPLNTRMPFPCLISKICRAQGAKSEKYRENGRLEPGIINSTVLAKSQSQSRHPRAAPGGSYLTEMPPRDATKPVWYKKMFCQGVAIIGSLRKDKKERREIARKQDRMEHRLEWLTSRAEGSSTEPYVPPAVVQAEDSDDFAGDEPVSGDDA